jgi:predicted GNAT family acetyltransferase
VAAMDHRLLRPRQRARTLYFKPTGGDFSWDALGNWYMDADYTRAATTLPTSMDAVVSVGEWVPLWTGRRTVSRFTLDDLFDGQGIAGELEARVVAEFRGAVEVAAAIIGNAVFNDDTNLIGSVSGTATFKDAACNAGGTAGRFIPDPPPACV